jgi:hypothetical protein
MMECRVPYGGCPGKATYACGSGAISKKEGDHVKRTVFVLTTAAAFSMLALAEDWSGKLLDSTCNENKDLTKASCDATGMTTAFVLEVSGKIYKLDPAGNTKAASALKNRADRSTDPAKPVTGPVTAKISGTEKDGTITVTSVDVQ